MGELARTMLLLAGPPRCANAKSDYDASPFLIALRRRCVSSKPSLRVGGEVDFADDRFVESPQRPVTRVLATCCLRPVAVPAQPTPPRRPEFVLHHSPHSR